MPVEFSRVEFTDDSTLPERRKEAKGFELIVSSQNLIASYPIAALQRGRNLLRKLPQRTSATRLFRNSPLRAEALSRKKCRAPDFYLEWTAANLRFHTLPNCSKPAIRPRRLRSERETHTASRPRFNLS